MTNEQQVVVNSKINNGYMIIGNSVSMTNGLTVVILSKGKHTLAINTLGYDEHYVGKSWKITD